MKENSVVTLYKRAAFTLIELIMVIVVFGILAMISADIFIKIYDNYILAKTINTLQTKTELALDQIAKRLQYRIKDSTIARNNGLNPPYRFLADANDSYHILEWIGYADEAFKGENNGTVNRPGWSGFIDLDVSSRVYAASPGSDLTVANNIITSLSTRASLTDTTKNPPAIVMDGHVGDYNVSSYGWAPHHDHNYALWVRRQNDATFLFEENTTAKELYEHYKLAWSAYAIVPSKSDGALCDEEDLNRSSCNLYLYYDYQPWKGESYDISGKSSLLAENVNAFKFSQTGEIVRLKLCIGETIYDENISFCKEKVVF